MSCLGIAIVIALCCLVSYDRWKVKWLTVLWSLVLQLLIGLVTIRVEMTRKALKWLGRKIEDFLDYSIFGREFLFGNITDPNFVMHVFPTIVFIGAFINLLYSLGIMQKLLAVIATVVKGLLFTTPGETLNAVANVFMSQTEAPLLIRPLLKNMTRSEIHAVMTAGFSTVCMAILSAYTAFDIRIDLLLSASVMSAPAALGISKLLYPETEQTSDDDINESAEEEGCIQAFSSGASIAMTFVINIFANLLAFVALLAFVNDMLIWFGLRVGIHDFSFEFICSYLFVPIAFAMGIPPRDCRSVARLLGIKLFVNELVAYQNLGELVQNTAVFEKHVLQSRGNYSTDNDNILLLLSNETQLLAHGIIQPRSVTITTYALCGFSNLASVGMQIAGLSTLVPAKKQVFSQLAVRAMIAGNIVCILTGCVAGLFYS